MVDGDGGGADGGDTYDGASDGDTYNSVSGGEQHHLIQGGRFTGPFTFNGPTTIGPPPGPAMGPPARSAYWEHVRRTAPRRLVDREAELADLADFCRGAGDRSYAWWRAGAWAGKTALLSWFALHPPPGVRVVPFFVTARWAAQNDRTAFVEVVLEQLAEMLGEPLPPNLTESTREAHLLQLLGQAAQACAARHEHLILLVDGLDEDRGVTAGPDAHSIAGLLPQPTVPALRVVVAGRPNPPIPTDVPDHHPLRTACAVRTLTPSERAGAIRGAAERELSRLFAKGGLHLDALGLITAARGGLTAEDLARLTESAPYELQEVLRTSAGRTFEVREGASAGSGTSGPEGSGSGGEAYLLAHEELHLQAERMLGAPRLDAFRQRLHAWADTYRERDWPADTPGYLLRGYFALVRAQQDLPRTVTLAADPARHERLYRATGGDVAALAEIRDAQEAIVEAGGRPHLPDMLRLTLHRDALTRRNAALPARLPEAWAALGHARRAVALAQSIPDPDERVDALLRVAERVRARGERGHAVEIVADLGAATAKDGGSGPRLDRVVGTWLAWGEVSRAADVAGLLPGGVWKEKALPAVVAAMAERGPAEDAERLARASGDDRTRTLSLIPLAEAAARGGEDERADALFAEARTAILDSHVLNVDAGWRVLVAPPVEPGVHRPADEDQDHLCCRALARALAVTGRREAAKDFVELLLSTEWPDDAYSVVAPSSYEITRDAADAARAEIALDIARSGDPEEAVRYLTAAESPATTSPQVARVCAVLVAAGRHELAEGVARSALGDMDVRRKVLLRLAEAGETGRAVDLATLLHRSPGVALDLCRVLVREGRHQDAEYAARTLLTPRDGLVDVALALAEAGRTAQALVLAETVRASAPTPQNLSAISLILLAAGCDDEAERTLAEAESGYRRVLPHLSDAESRAEVAGHLARAGCPEQALLLLADAEALLRAETERQHDHEDLWDHGDTGFTPPFPTPTVLDPLRSLVVDALVEAGEVDRALGHITANRLGTARELTLVVRRLAADGRANLAEAVVRGLPDPADRATARWAIVEVLAGRGADADTVAVSQLLARLSEGDFPVEALAQGITRLAAVGRRDLALELHAQLVATPVNPTQSRGESVARARAAYAVGDHPTAEELLAKADRGHPQDMISPDLVRGLLATGQAERAEEYIREQLAAPDAWVLLDDLPELIRILTEAGEHDRAEALLESFPRAPAVRDAYVVLARALPPDRAAPAAARAAHFGPWTAALPALLHADPATVAVLTAPEVWSRLLTAPSSADG